MLNRRQIPLISTLCICMMLLASAAMAQDVRSYVVLPFKYVGPTTYQYFKQAFQSDISSKLEWGGHYEPRTDLDVKDLMLPANEAAALQMTKNLGVDYLSWGDISILGKTATVNLFMQGQDGTKWSRSGQMEINKINKWLAQAANDIMGDVYNRPGYGQDAVSKGPEREAYNGPKGADFLQGDGGTGEAAYQQSLNPQFRYEGGTENQGRWRSQTLRYPSVNMIVGDADGDGQNEIFIAGKHTIYAYRFENGKLADLGSYELSPRSTLLRLELFDVNRDGAMDLIVGAYRDERPWSSIVSFKGGQFKDMIPKSRLYLGVLAPPPAYTPMLVAQKQGARWVFDKYIYEAYVTGGDVTLGSKIATPPFGTPYNIAYLPDGDSYKVLTLGDSRKVRVYTPDMERQYESQDTFNTSVIGIEYMNITPGMGPPSTKMKIATELITIPFHMEVASLSRPGKYELLVNKDITMAGQIFERFRVFSQGEVQSLFWDGVGMNLAWKTRRIKGAVTDLGIADLDNDGTKELVVLVNTYPGSLGFRARKTVVLTYSLGQ